MTGPVIHVDGLEKTYSSSSGAVRAVDGVSFAVAPGEVLGVLGPNGAGKTTTIKCILGLVIRSAGTVEIDGVDPAADPDRAYRRVSAVLEGARNVYWRLTVRENLRFFGGCHGVHPSDTDGRYERLISTVGLEGHGDVQVRHLSRGMQQKASLACALARDTPVMVLDEPTLGLDVEASADLRRQIRHLADQEDRTIVLSSHDMDTVQEVCDRVIIMNDGEVVANDSVERLIEVFRTQTYRITFAAGQVPAAARHGIDARQIGDRERPTVEAVLTDSDELYDLMDACRAAGARIDRIESVEPDLEEVFLRVLDGASVGQEAGIRGERP